MVAISVQTSTVNSLTANNVDYCHILDHRYLHRCWHTALLFYCRHSLCEKKRSHSENIDLSRRLQSGTRADMNANKRLINKLSYDKTDNNRLHEMIFDLNI